MKFNTITLAIFAAGDVKGSKETAHAVRMSYVRKAFVSALRGNATELIQGQAAAVGKNEKAKAYAAGFAAVGAVAKHAYTGALKAADAAVIETMADTLADKFSEAFAGLHAVVDAAPKTDAEKAVAKAKKAEKADERGAAWAKQKGLVPASEVKGVTLREASPAFIADAVADMIRTGALDASNIKVIADAMKDKAADDKAAAAINKAQKTPKTDKATA